MLPSTLELLKKSLSLYKNNKLVFLKYALLVIVPVIVTSVSKIFFNLSLYNNLSRPLLIIALVVVFLLNLATLLGCIIMVRIVYNRYQGNPIDSMIKEIKLALPLLLPTLWIVLLFKAIKFAGLLLFIIPALVFSIWFFFSFHARVIDQKKGLGAFLSSKHLVKGVSWDILWLVLSTSFIVFGSLTVVQTLLRFIVTFLMERFTKDTLFLQIGGFTSLFINIIVLPFLIFVLPTVLYSDLKKAKQQN